MSRRTYIVEVDIDDAKVDELNTKRIKAGFQARSANARVEGKICDALSNFEEFSNPSVHMTGVTTSQCAGDEVI